MSKRSIIILITIISLISGYKLLSKSEYSRNAITIEKNSHYSENETTEVIVTETEAIKEEITETRKATESQPKVKVNTADLKLVAKDKDKSEETDRSITQSDTGSYKAAAESDNNNTQNIEVSIKTDVKTEDTVEMTTQTKQPEKVEKEKPKTEAATEAKTEARTEAKIQNKPEAKTQNTPEVKQPVTEADSQNKTEATTQTIVENTAPAPCNHNWVWKTHTETIHHDAEYTEYLVCEAYDENIYESHTFCNNCNLDMTINFGGASSSEAADHMLNVCGGCGYHSGQAVVGTIHHDAEYGSYCSVAPYDEYVEVNDYKYCSICGERK